MRYVWTSGNVRCRFDFADGVVEKIDVEKVLFDITLYSILVLGAFNNLIMEKYYIS